MLYRYVNFAHGDEDLSEIYGESLGRLRQVKKQYDPHNRFNQWFPIHLRLAPKASLYI